MIRAHVGGVAKEDLRSFLRRKGFGLEHSFLSPLLDQRPAGRYTDGWHNIGDLDGERRESGRRLEDRPN